MTGKTESPAGKEVKYKAKTSGTPSGDHPIGSIASANKGGDEGKVDEVKVTLNFHGSCVDKKGKTWVVFGGLIRTKNVVFVYGGNHKDTETECIIASKQQAEKLGKKFSKKEAEKHGKWKPISESTAKLMGLREGLKIALEMDGEKNNSVCEVENDGSVLSLIGKRGEYVEYVLNSSKDTYEVNTNTSKGILADCMNYSKKLKCKSKTTNIEFKVRVNNLGM